MNHLFGRKKQPEPAEEAPDLNAAVGRMDERVAKLDEKIKKCDEELYDYKKKMRSARGSAKESYKQRAMRVLKTKRAYEQQRDQIAAQGFNVEQTAFTMDSLRTTADTVKTMESTAQHMRQAMKDIDVDKVEDLHDQLSDLMFDAEEVQEVMGRSYGVPEAVDEDDLMAELGGLEDEVALENEGESSGGPSYLEAAAAAPAYAPMPAPAPAAAVGVERDKRGDAAAMRAE